MSSTVRPTASRLLSIIYSTILFLSRFRLLRIVAIRLCNAIETDYLPSDLRIKILKRFYDVEIGKYSYGPIMKPGLLPRGTKLGRYCSIGAELLVIRRSHPDDRPSLHPFFYLSTLGYVSRDTIPINEDNPLTIGNDVWIGARVIILHSCKKIGNGAIVGAGAVLTRDVAPYSIVGGVPAKLIRMRFDEHLIEMSEKSAWWEQDIDELRGNIDVFTKKASTESFKRLKVDDDIHRNTVFDQSQ